MRLMLNMKIKFLMNWPVITFDHLSIFPMILKSKDIAKLTNVKMIKLFEVENMEKR